MTTSVISNFKDLKDRVERLATNKSIVGFDIFDTLIRRRVEPEYVKDLVAQFLANTFNKQYNKNIDWKLIRKKRFELEIQLGKKNEEKGLDHEFLYDDLLLEWLKEVDSNMDIPNYFVMVKNKEIELEKTAQCLTPNIEQLLSYLKEQNKKLIFISDMYFSIDTIWGFLENLNIAKYFDKGFCSSQFMLKKSTGRLFDHIIQAENIDSSTFLFMGDNFYSDVDMPSKKGIDTIHIADIQEKKRRVGLNLHQWLSSRNKYWTGKYVDYIIENISVFDSKDNENYKLGRLMAPILVLFVLNIMEQAKLKNIKKIAFLAREGKVFHDIYQNIIQTYKLEKEYPEAVYLYVSRKSTYLSSMKELSWKEISRFMSQYNSQSFNSLLKNLSLPAEKFYSHAYASGIKDFDEIIVDAENHQAFLRFINNEEVKRLFVQYRDEARLLFKTYLEQEGIFSVDKVAFVDVGWKGTIQDNIVRAFEEYKDFPDVYGYYIGLVTNSSNDNLRSQKFGFLADTRENNHINNVVFKNGSVFEMCTTPNHGTTVGYQYEGKIVKPILVSYEEEHENFRNHFADVFAAIHDYTKSFLKTYPLFDSNLGEAKYYYFDQVRRYILYPTRNEVKSFMKYKHVESFGVFQVTTFEFKGEIIRELFKWPLHKAPARIKQLIKKQLWPEAVIKQTNIPFANFISDLITTRKKA